MNKPVTIGLMGTPEECAALSPKIAAECFSVFRSLAQMLNDPEHMDRISRQFYEGQIGDVQGFDWYCDPDPKLYPKVDPDAHLGAVEK